MFLAELNVGLPKVAPEVEWRVEKRDVLFAVRLPEIKRPAMHGGELTIDVSAAADRQEA
jgi:hypothetical protein